jgi:hypothetical protein
MKQNIVLEKYSALTRLLVQMNGCKKLRKQDILMLSVYWAVVGIKDNNPVWGIDSQTGFVII